MFAYSKMKRFLAICLMLQGVKFCVWGQSVPLAEPIPSAKQNVEKDQLRPSPATTAQTQGVIPSVQSTPQRAFEILQFWFGYLPSPGYFPKEKIPFWFGMAPELDRQIQENFGSDLQRASRGEYNNWRETPKGRLALIILLDQFPRHIYRNRPQSFMFDRMARTLVLEGIQKKDDLRLYPIERAFFYLPLEHAENLDLQERAVEAYRQLLVASPMSIKPQIHGFLIYALLHRQQIAFFGRFPHRNAILNRKSTPEEIIFLSQWEFQ